MAVDPLALVKFVIGISGTVLLVVLYVVLGMSLQIERRTPTVQGLFMMSLSVTEAQMLFTYTNKKNDVNGALCIRSVMAFYSSHLFECRRLVHSLEMRSVEALLL